MLSETYAATAAQTLPVFAFAAGVSLNLRARQTASRVKPYREMLNELLTSFEDAETSIAAGNEADRDEARAKLSERLEGLRARLDAGPKAVTLATWMMVNFLVAFVLITVLFLDVVAEAICVFVLSGHQPNPSGSGYVSVAMVGSMAVLVTVPALFAMPKAALGLGYNVSDLKLMMRWSALEDRVSGRK